MTDYELIDLLRRQVDYLARRASIRALMWRETGTPIARFDAPSGKIVDYVPEPGAAELFGIGALRFRIGERPWENCYELDPERIRGQKRQE